MMITLQTIPVDCLLHVGTFLKSPRSSKRNDIDGITLAAILKDYEMLERYMKTQTPQCISEKVALSGNPKSLEWVVQKGCPLDHWTITA